MISNELLGKGEFSNVYAVLSLLVHDYDNNNNINNNKNNNEEEDKDNEMKEDKEAKLYMKSHCLRYNGEPRYAVKCFNKTIYQESLKTCKMRACHMLQTETDLLTKLYHPCIIKLRATANLDAMDVEYFIVLDRLQCTLREKLYLDWLPRYQELGGGGMMIKLRRACSKKKKLKAHDLLVERLLALVDLASAIKFLHENNVIYRDLKPENIGFDIRGDLKLFDFGLSRELPPDTQKDKLGLYQMTCRTGSRRYMSPESTLGYPYNLSSDVYSYSTLAWEIITMKQRLHDINVRQHEILIEQEVCVLASSITSPKNFSERRTTVVVEEEIKLKLTLRVAVVKTYVDS